MAGPLLMQKLLGCQAMKKHREQWVLQTQGIQ